MCYNKCIIEASILGGKIKFHQSSLIESAELDFLNYVLFIYLKWKVTEIIYPDSFPRRPQQPWLDQAEARLPMLASHGGIRDPSTWCIIPAFSGTLAGSWIGSTSGRTQPSSTLICDTRVLSGSFKALAQRQPQS